ncbi:MAG: radical SAM protein [Corynebacterium sp.]|nr:radical SAM protein [Corynebacterium sp.]
MENGVSNVHEYNKSDLGRWGAPTNELLERKDELIQLGLAPDSISAPLYALWEITGACPLRCNYCYNESPQNIKNLSREDLIKIARSLTDGGIFGVCLSGGEPLVSKHWHVVANELVSHGIPVSLITSGWTVTKTIAREVAKLVESVSVSLDGLQPTHDRIRGRENSFCKAIDAIQLFQDAGTKRLEISYAVSSANSSEIDKIVDLAEELNIDRVRLHPVVGIGRAQKLKLGNEDRITNSICQAMRKNSERKVTVVQDSIDGNLRIAQALKRWVTCRIKPNGEVTPSGAITQSAGNLTTDSLTAVWSRVSTTDAVNSIDPSTKPDILNIRGHRVRIERDGSSFVQTPNGLKLLNKAMTEIMLSSQLELRTLKNHSEDSLHDALVRLVEDDLVDKEVLATL